MGTGVDAEAWVGPLWDDVPVGESPLVGETAEECHELEADPA